MRSFGLEIYASSLGIFRSFIPLSEPERDPFCSYYHVISLRPHLSRRHIPPPERGQSSQNNSTRPMQSVTLGINSFPDNSGTFTRGIPSEALSDRSTSPSLNLSFGAMNNGIDPSQLQHLAHLLSAAQGSSGTGGSGAVNPSPQGPSSTAAMAMAKQTAVVECPKSMVGRVIGKGGDTIKSLQQYTGAMIQIDQSTDPTRVTIAGSPQSLQLAVSMVNDIVKGTFKGFAMLRQIAMTSSAGSAPTPFGAQPHPVYVQGYGFVPPSQVFNTEQETAFSGPLVRGGTSTGNLSAPLTPPITPLRATDNSGSNVMSGFPDSGLVSLLAAGRQQNIGPRQQQQQVGQNYLQPNVGSSMSTLQQSQQRESQEALIAALLSQLAVQQQQQQQPLSRNIDLSGPANFGQQYNSFGDMSAGNREEQLSQFISQGIRQQNDVANMSLPPSASLLNSSFLANQRTSGTSSASPPQSLSAPLSPSGAFVPGGNTTGVGTGSIAGGSSPGNGQGSPILSHTNPAENNANSLAASSPFDGGALRTSGSREGSPLGQLGGFGTSPSGAAEAASGTSRFVDRADFPRSLWSDI